MMKMSRTPLLLCLLFFLSEEAITAQRTYINQNWLFMPGDSIARAEANYNDSGWKKVNAGMAWQQFGYTGPGYGWYRYHFIPPKKLKTAMHNKGFIRINFGYTADAAQYFFNGRGLGESGTLPPRFIHANLSRPVEYYISEDEIRWDTLNIISIRVYSADTLRGGIFKGPLYYYVPKTLK